MNQPDPAAPMTHEQKIQMLEDHNRHTAVIQMMRLFTYSHLPPNLQSVSKPICDLAWDMVNRIPDTPMLTRGLDKLWEAKNCLVMAVVVEDEKYLG